MDPPHTAVGQFNPAPAARSQGRPFRFDMLIDDDEEAGVLIGRTGQRFRLCRCALVFEGVYRLASQLSKERRFMFPDKSPEVISQTRCWRDFQPVAVGLDVEAVRTKAV